MPIGEFANGEAFGSIRTKLNAVINVIDNGVLVRGSGQLFGYTVPGVPASAPPDLLLELFAGAYYAGTATIIINSTAYVFTFATMDPSDGTIFIDNSSSDPTYISSLLSNAINALSLSGISANPDGVTVVTVTNTSVGSGYNQTAYSDISGSLISGGGDGTDEVPPSGEVTEVELIAQSGTKTLRPVRCGWYGGVNADVQIALKASGTYYPLHADAPANSAAGEAEAGEHYSNWIGSLASASLVARLMTTTPEGGSIVCWAIAERV